MTPIPIVFWGATGQAKVLREFLSALGYELVACFDNNSAVTAPFADVPLAGDWKGFARWRERNPGPIACAVAIGGAKGEDRLKIQNRLAQAGLRPATLVHSTAFVASNATVGVGSQILPMSAVCAEARIGQSCIVNTRASVDHECVLGDGVHIGPGATLCGNVVAGDYAFVGAGATVLPRVHIGRNAIVGAGAVVARDVPDGTCVVGVPARQNDREPAG